MLFSMVWVLAAVTAWCVASLALALVVGPMLRRADRPERRRQALQEQLGVTLTSQG